MAWKNSFRVDSINDEYYEVILSYPKYIYKIYYLFFDYTKYKTYEELLNNNNIIKKDLKCKEGFKNCGIIDTLDQQLCLPENINCPLNDIKMIYADNTQEFEYYREKGYKFHFCEETAIFFSNNQKDKPIIGRIVLNGGQPCANPLEITWEKVEFQENNSSRTCKTKYKGNLYDETYIEFGNITYNDLYHYNLDWSDYHDMCSKKMDETYFYLYKNRFIGIDKKCLKNSKIKDIPETTNMVDLLEGIRKYSKPFGVVNFFFIILILIFDLCYHKYKKDVEEDSYLDVPEKFYLPLNFVAFLLYIFCFVYFVERTAFFDCSDEIINDKMRRLNRQLIVMEIATFGYDLLFFIFIVIVCLRRIYKKIKNGNNIFSDYFNL